MKFVVQVSLTRSLSLRRNPGQRQLSGPLIYINSSTGIVTMTIMVSTRLPVQRAVAQVTVVTVTPAGEIIINYLRFSYSYV